MTPKQKDVYIRLLQGKSYRQIASELYISKETVKTHCRHIYRIFSVKNRTELLAVTLNTNQQPFHVE
jgi:DNA-binding CsgD family transcriptional regulator